MKTLHRYILSNFIVTFVLALLVLTFVMMIGLVFGSMKFISRGMSAALFFKFLFQSMPGTLSYSMPVAALVSSLLVFSRLSSDSEISAMRSCGVPLVSIMRTPALLAALLSLACLHVNNSVTPGSNYSRAVRRASFKAGDMTALLDPGRWTEVGDYNIFVRRRKGDVMEDLRVTQPMRNGKLREFRSATATLVAGDAGSTVLAMRDVTIDPWQEDELGMMHAETWRIPLAALDSEKRSAEERIARSAPRRRIKDIETWMLLRDVFSSSAHPPRGDAEASLLSRAKAEIASRVTLAAACLCFVLVGVPLGIQSHRRESSVGLAISLAVAGAFYLFCLTGESLSKHPATHAHFIILLPVPLCLALAFFVIRRQN